MSQSRMDRAIFRERGTPWRKESSYRYEGSVLYGIA
jgi:hypothetical protein